MVEMVKSIVRSLNGIFSYIKDFEDRGTMDDVSSYSDYIIDYRRFGSTILRVSVYSVNNGNSVIIMTVSNVYNVMKYPDGKNFIIIFMDFIREYFSKYIVYNTIGDVELNFNGDFDSILEKLDNFFIYHKLNIYGI